MNKKKNVLLIVSLTINVGLLITTFIFATLFFARSEAIDVVSMKVLDTKEDSVLYTAEVISAYVNVRLKPSLYSDKLGVLKEGETVEVYEDDGEWAKIIYNGDFAYCSSKYILALK